MHRQSLIDVLLSSFFPVAVNSMLSEVLVPTESHPEDCLNIAVVEEEGNIQAVRRRLRMVSPADDRRMIRLCPPKISSTVDLAVSNFAIELIELNVSKSYWCEVD